MLSFSLQSPRLAVSLLRQASISKHDMHTPTNMYRCTVRARYTYAHCTMQSLISQLQQIRTNVIVFDPKCAGALGKQ